MTMLGTSRRSSIAGADIRALHAEGHDSAAAATSGDASGCEVALHMPDEDGQDIAGGAKVS
jgi:hypothetical protein